MADEQEILPECVWVHRKCASDNDEMVKPIAKIESGVDKVERLAQYPVGKERTCQYCGKYGHVFQYVWDEKRVLVVNEKGDVIGEGEGIPEIVEELVAETIEEAVIEAEGLTDGQEVPLELEEVVGSVETLVEEILEEKAPDNETMTLGEQIAEIRDVETASAQELHDDAVIPIPPDNETLSLDEQIAELQAKKAELEAKEE